MANDKLELERVVDAEARRRGTWDRREFVKGAAALAGPAATLGYDLTAGAAEPPPETARIRLGKIPGICIAPQYVAEALLHAEGFTAVQYITTEAGTAQSRALAAGEVDATINYAA